MGSYEGVLRGAAKLTGISYVEYIIKKESGLKHCTKCKSWKPLKEFGNDSTRGDGLDATCFVCRHVKVRINTKGRPSPFKGKHHTEKAKKLVSLKNKGKKPRLGIKHTEKAKQKISMTTRKIVLRGKNHPRWKGGSGRYIRAYNGHGYKAWRRDVFGRDNYICQECGDNKGGNLEAHHKISFRKCIGNNNGLEFDINNGITLCENCHKKVHKKIA